eukprot:2724533-Rhodomonas_salina.2
MNLSDGRKVQELRPALKVRTLPHGGIKVLRACLWVFAENGRVQLCWGAASFLHACDPCQQLIWRLTLALMSEMIQNCGAESLALADFRRNFKDDDVCSSFVPHMSRHALQESSDRHVKCQKIQIAKKTR